MKNQTRTPATPEPSTLYQILSRQNFFTSTHTWHPPSKAKKLQHTERLLSSQMIPYSDSTNALLSAHLILQSFTEPKPDLLKIYASKPKMEQLHLVNLLSTLAIKFQMLDLNYQTGPLFLFSLLYKAYGLLVINIHCLNYPLCICRLNLATCNTNLILSRG